MISVQVGLPILTFRMNVLIYTYLTSVLIRFSVLSIYSLNKDIQICTRMIIDCTQFPVGSKTIVRLV